jgi:hypothetical protein
MARNLKTEREKVQFHGVLTRGRRVGGDPIPIETDDFFVASSELNQCFELMLLGVSSELVESSEGVDVSVIGTLVPRGDDQPSGLDLPPLVAVEHFARHDAIALRAYEIFHSPSSRSTLDNWLRAERELLFKSGDAQ